MTLPTARRRSAVFGAAALAMLPLASLRAAAADWPERTIRIVIPFAAGASSDVVARLLAAKLAERLGQAVIVESKPGANGIIATDAVAKAAPDGHTLLLTSAGHAINASLYAKLPYDSAADFVPISLVAPPGPLVLVVHPSVPATNLKQLVDHARANPEKLSYGSAGVGNTLHIAGEMFAQAANVKLLHVPYKGAAPILNDLLAGQISMMFNSALAVAPQVQEGKLRLIAQTGAERSPVLPPDLPTFAEAGVAGVEIAGWFGLFAPAKTPSAVVQRLNAEVRRAMALPDVLEKIRLLGAADAPTLDPRQFADFVQAETARYARVVKAAGIVLEAKP